MTTFILGIDTSCDDTSAAVLQDGYTVLSNVVSSQISLHQPYGGVFPTVAKLAHQQNILPVVTAALAKAHLSPSQLHAVAVTVGPGLAPALEIGLTFAKNFAHDHQLPLIAINHLEGHLLSPLVRPHSRSFSLTHFASSQNHHQFQSQSISSPSLSQLHFPLLGIIVSGGHTEFIQVNSFGNYHLLGHTLDDAAGECLDKIGRLLNLGYPAAPVIEELAKSGDPTKYRFPLPLTDRHDFDCSFSGLKTYARNLITGLEAKNAFDRQDISHLAASAQAGIFLHLLYKLNKLLAYYQKSPSQIPFTGILIGGGVSQNIYFRQSLRRLARPYQLPLYFPYHKKICGDNATMIAAAAYHHYQAKHFADLDTLERQPNLDL